MSIREFHSQLVSGSNTNPLFEALRKLRTLTDPQVLFDKEVITSDWPLWEGNVNTAVRAQA